MPLTLNLCYCTSLGMEGGLSHSHRIYFLLLSIAVQYFLAYHVWDHVKILLQSHFSATDEPGGFLWLFFLSLPIYGAHFEPFGSPAGCLTVSHGVSLAFSCVFGALVFMGASNTRVKQCLGSLIWYIFVYLGTYTLSKSCSSTPVYFKYRVDKTMNTVVNLCHVIFPPHPL